MVLSSGNFSLGGEGLGEKLSRAKEVVTGSSIDVEPYDPERHAPLVSPEEVEGFEEVERYWVNAPYAYVSIDFDQERNENVYRVVEPALDAAERGLLDALFDDMRRSLIFREDADTGDPGEVLKDQMRTLLEEYGAEVGMDTFHRLFYYLRRSFRGYDRIDPIMHDPRIEDISCNGYGLPVYVYHEEYTNMQTNVRFGDEALDSFVVRLSQQSGRHLSIGSPIIGTTLPDGSRIELDYEQEVTPKGSAFTIRRFGEEPMTPTDLVDFGTFSLDQMAYLWLAIENNKSLIFAGGTASGKTTSMNAASMFVPPRSKVLSIEDTRELVLYHENWLSSLTRERPGGEGEITIYDLLRSALRHRPEYIIVGEVRGQEAITLFQAMNTGHTTYSTMHADSIHTVINRLENQPLNVPRVMLQALDIISVQTLTFLGDKRVRRTRYIYEVEGIDPSTGELTYSTVFSWDPSSDTFSRRDSQVLEEIQEDRGWSRTELLQEFQRRKKVLRYLDETDAGPAAFTAMVNEYQLRPETVLERVEDHAGGGDAE